MDWYRLIGILLGSVSAFAIAAGLLTWLAKTLFSKALDAGLERYRAELERQSESFRSTLARHALEHEVRFRDLHSYRVARILRVHRAMESATGYAMAFCKPLQWGGLEAQRERGDLANKWIQRFAIAAFRSKLAFDEKTSSKLEQIWKKLDGAFFIARDVFETHEQESKSPGRDPEFMKAFQTIQSEIVPMVSEMTEAFRQMLGSRGDSE